MPVEKTHISWTDSTVNPTVGCTHASAGCDNCYAESMVNRLMGGNFGNIRLHPDRIAKMRTLKAIRGPGGHLRPRLVFVNSMSDLMHDLIPEDFKHRVFDAMEANENCAWQVLTKRAVQLRQFVQNRYGNRGVPDHIWLGVSVEDNRVAGRINILRRLKDRVGGMTAFLSVEPLIGPVDQHDYTDIDQVLVGGESGPGRRRCAEEWMRQSLAEARRAGAAIHLKQWGHPVDNPLVAARMASRGLTAKQAFIEVCQIGLELAPEEKGGATIDGTLLREKPPVYEALRARLLTAVSA